MGRAYGGCRSRLFLREGGFCVDRFFLRGVAKRGELWVEARQAQGFGLRDSARRVGAARGFEFGLGLVFVFKNGEFFFGVFQKFGKRFGRG